MIADTIREYSAATKSVGEALIPFATLAILVWKAGIFKKRRRAAKKSSDPFNYREGIAALIYLAGTACYFYTIYVGWGHPSVEAMKWHLITIGVFMASIAVNSTPISKPDVLLLTSLLLLVVLEITQLTFLILKEVVPQKTPSTQTSP